MALHEATTTGKKASSKKYLCCVCNETHRDYMWGIAYHLNQTGGMFATITERRFVSPGWCCQIKYRNLCNYYSECAEKKEINSTSSFKFVDLSPCVKFQSKPKIDGPDYIIASLERLIDFLDSNSVCKECKCYGALQCTNYQQKGFDSLLSFECFNCKNKLILNSSSNLEGSSRQVLSKKLICASQFSGINVEQLFNAFDLTGLPHYSNQSAVYEVTTNIWDKVTELTDEALLENLKYMGLMKLMADGLSFFGVTMNMKENRLESQCLIINNQYYYLPQEIMLIIWSFYPKKKYIPLYISIDGRWSKARNANECTVAAIESCFDLIVQRYNTIRDRISREGNFKGASKCAEGNGVDHIMDWIVNQIFDLFGEKFYFEVRSFAHDHDGSTRNIIHEHFPNAQEYLDVNHKGKNIAKHVAGIAKGWGTVVSVAFKVAVTVADNNTNILKTILNAYVDHWCGNHDKCYGDGCKSSKPKIDPNNTELIEKLKKVFTELAESADSYKKSAHTQSNESLNNSMCKFVSKRYDFSKSYSGRVDLAVLFHTHGHKSFITLMKQLNVPLSEYSMYKLSKKDAKGLWHRERKLSVEYKGKRKANKENHKKLHKKVIENYEYKKGDPEFTEETQQSTQLIISEKEIHHQRRRK
ncbi:predicted protein [Naegleria gruberi]|uniref:Predicted protein n=1 Tax=Naegleria gruberi TaxID=5762 RepID=D2W639_NAEGR|nr:uncharacterized protein NAEGRDRAFT_54899 [Naegleria gruberi]EFC35463.1 predicted protein [Naegleria gruberi]|eukprot:XP_002668207.1 predicted protein [Naegleria gruberi strain NEG-M]